MGGWVEEQKVAFGFGQMVLNDDGGRERKNTRLRCDFPAFFQKFNNINFFILKSYIIYELRKLRTKKHVHFLNYNIYLYETKYAFMNTIKAPF